MKEYNYVLRLTPHYGDSGTVPGKEVSSGPNIPVPVKKGYFQQEDRFG